TDFIIGKLRQTLGAVAMAGFGEELRQRELHGTGNLRERVERRDGVAVFHARQVAAQKSGSLFDVALRHTFLQPVVADGLADIHCGEHFRMGHSNQISIFWQVGNSCYAADIGAIRESNGIQRSFTHVQRFACTACKQPIGANARPAGCLKPSYFFSVPARKSTVRVHASAASAARYPSLLLGFSKAWPASS